VPTKIEEIYNELTTVIEAALPNYRRFPNPYVIEANTFLHMSAGFGIAIGPGTDTERYVGCLITQQRSFSIVLVRQMLATQNDLDTRELIEKQILDDHDALRKAIYSNSTLSGKVIETTLTDDGGVNFIDGRLKFLSMEMNIVTEYQEGI